MALQKGDRIQLQFAASQWTWMRAWQISQIENRLEYNTAFTLISADYWQEYHVIFTIEILDPIMASGEIIAEKEIIDAILAANPMGYVLIFEKDIIQPAIKKTVEVAKMAAPLVGTAGIIIILILILMLKK